jgi:phospholipid/cholesterol/gamma-HCH transport system substrate-binding protein
VREEQHSSRQGGRWKFVIVVAVIVGAVLAGTYYLVRRPLLAALATGPEYHARFHTVGGLRKGDQVRYGGLPVGRTRAVSIDPSDPTLIVVTFRVDKSTPIRTDTRASVVDITNPVTRYLSLRGLSRGAPALAPGHEVASETGPTPEETMARVTTLLARADTLFDAAAPLLHGDFFARLGKTTERLDRMTAAVVRSSSTWGPGVERAMGRLDTVVTRTDHLLATIDSASPDLRASITEALGMLHESRTLVAELRAGADEGGGLAELMRNLTSTSDDLSRLAAKLDRNPTSVLRGQRPIPKTAGPPLHD